MRNRPGLTVDILHLFVWMIILLLAFVGIFPWWAVGLIALSEIKGFSVNIPLTK